MGDARLVAMGLVWQYADVCGNPKWKGLTWGMLPLHTSGICACTYHFFYNSPEVEVPSPPPSDIILANLCDV
eukprot:5629329-Pyramimonas_sp.AAC.2